MDLNSEVISDIVELCDARQPQEVIIDGISYTSRERFKKVDPPRPSTLMFCSLDGIAGYINENRDGLALDELLVTVSDYKTVRLIGKLSPVHRDREVYAQADMRQTNFEFGQWFPQEDFIIQLQSLFVDNSTNVEIQKTVAAMTDSEVRVSRDDGISQEVSTKVSLASTDWKEIKNPVKLQPWRTFREVEQPESNFILRVKKSSSGPQIALFQADGGAWKLQAVEAIVIYLSDSIGGKVKVIG